MVIQKLQKIWTILVNPSFLIALTKGAAAGTEHLKVLAGLKADFIVDVGANRGQFALAARKVFPHARIYSFEPLEEPGKIFKKLFIQDPNTTFHAYAIGREKTSATIHVTRDDDSSSLLPITNRQSNLFPGALEKETRQISVLPLSIVLEEASIPPESLLKIDVQGLELEVLMGCGESLGKFSHIYVECSFLELYQGQALAKEVIEFLHFRGFAITGVYNVCYDNKGIALQADLLFSPESK